MTYPDSGADHLADRRILRRRLSFWRIAAFAALAVAVMLAGWRIAGGRGALLQKHIARVSISGLITGDRATIKLLDDVADSPAAQALILSIESPGGTTSGAERLYEAIRRVAAKKTVVAAVRGMAASGGYIAALGADRIIAQQTSLVGSIGVLIQFPNVSKLLDTVGVKVEEIKSSPLKAAPDGLAPTSDAAHAAIAALVADSFDWFRNLVRDRRQLNDTELAAVADGRVFTGRQGLDLHLVDALGGERDAVAWLEASRNIRPNLPVTEWRKDQTIDQFGIFSAAAALADSLGLTVLSRTLMAFEDGERLRVLDGLLAVWHGGVVN